MSDISVLLLCFSIAAALVAGLAWLLTRIRQPEQVPYSSVGE